MRAVRIVIVSTIFSFLAHWRARHDVVGSRSQLQRNCSKQPMENPTGPSSQLTLGLQPPGKPASNRPGVKIRRESSFNFTIIISWLAVLAIHAGLVTAGMTAR